jgi:peroxiredoxin
LLTTGDYTPVCTTELGKIAAYNPEFQKRGVKLLGLSTDSVEDHQGWIKDIESYTVRISASPNPHRKYITSGFSFLAAEFLSFLASESA